MKNPSKTIVLKSKNWHLASLMVIITISVAILFVVFSRRLARIYKDDAESSSVITSSIKNKINKQHIQLSFFF
jgi:ABC-type bacteriocin/lantibiotic exporter with double-glycine peptidase domain